MSLNVIILFNIIIIVAVFEIVGLTSQFATQNCLSCYSKLNLDSKFYAKVITHLPHMNITL